MDSITWIAARLRALSGSRIVAAMRAARALLLLTLAACKVREQPAIESSYTDDFGRTSLGPDWTRTGSGYRIVDGALNARGAHNHPLWLARRLPAGDVQVDLDAWSTSPDGDIKVEIFGDGRSYDPDGNRYTATGYVLCMGGWKNSTSFIARKDEHGGEMVKRAQPKVVPGQRYHWRIVRRRDTIEWFVDDMSQPFLRYQDPQPLAGPGNGHFAINNWETDTWFDNLVIRRLAPSS